MENTILHFMVLNQTKELRICMIIIFPESNIDIYNIQQNIYQIIIARGWRHGFVCIFLGFLDLIIHSGKDRI